jgi:hypothetical protein
MSNRQVLKDLAIEKKFNETKEKLAQMITDADFTKYFTDAPEKTLKYSQLSDIKDINELLPDERDYRIILTESKRNEGHWCCIMKYTDIKTGKKYIEWFDSYSGKPDSELAFIPDAIKKMLGQDKNYLSRILKTVKEPYTILYNSKRYQTLKDGINTCGRWCILRLILFHTGYTLADFKAFIKESSKLQGGKPFDILVVDWI